MEEVKEVLVDGKPFFGNDPNAALKNLPAEVISKIQVFDQRSDQANILIEYCSALIILLTKTT